MDDANVPSLLSLPFLGYLKMTDDLYQRTRSMVLIIDGNPYYNAGSRGAAIGSPHTGIQHVWCALSCVLCHEEVWLTFRLDDRPMSLITQILTSDNGTEISQCLETILNNTAALALIHESFDVQCVLLHLASSHGWRRLDGLLRPCIWVHEALKEATRGSGLLGPTATLRR
jgi:meiotically up-regulated gene 157 (Mug157) protein